MTKAEYTDTIIELDEKGIQKIVKKYKEIKE
jgi:hypothetical protein